MNERKNVCLQKVKLINGGRKRILKLMNDHLNLKYVMVRKERWMNG